MADICAECQEPLSMDVEPDSDLEDEKAASQEVTKIPDDVELSCGCHYHWECFMEAYSITECPNCQQNVSSLNASGKQQVVVTVRSEGGTETDFDILPTATEEAYLRAYPEERRGHAYLEFCREGDLDAVINMLRDSDGNDAEEEDLSIDLIRYLGTFEGVDGTGLHVAIRYGHEEIAWLELALGTALSDSKFPPAVLEAMEEHGLNNKSINSGVDIRMLEDSEGRTPLDIAKEVGGLWQSWVRSGRLNPPAHI